MSDSTTKDNANYFGMNDEDEITQLNEDLLKAKHKIEELETARVDLCEQAE